MTIEQWYGELIKPWFAPEPWIFGLAWGIIYPLILIAVVLITRAVIKKEVSRIVLLPLTINLIFNLSFSYVQFNLKNNILALIWIIVVLSSLCWLLAVIRKRMPTATLLLLPYVFWGTFATILQVSITYLNL